jgi:hypothetical protein
MKDIQEKLRQIYYDPLVGLMSANKLYLKLNKKVPLDVIQDFIEKQEASQLHKKTGKINYFPISGPAGTFQADLTFFDQIKRSNEGFHVLLTAIEVNSRKAYVRPLKNKSQASIVEAFSSIIDEAQDFLPVKVLGTDQGSELKSDFQKMLSSQGIEYYSSDAGTHNTMGMVERFNRTLREMIEKYLTAYNTNKYIDVLDDLLFNYNNSVHSVTGFKPDKVGEKELKVIFQQKSEQQAKAFSTNQPLAVGQKVRRIKDKNLFEKGATAKYHKGVYEISKVNAFSYLLRNESGDVLRTRFKSYQLQAVDEIEQNPAVDKTYNRETEVKRYLNEKELKKEGIEEANLLEGSRKRTKPEKFKMD